MCVLRRAVCVVAVGHGQHVGHVPGHRAGGEGRLGGWTGEGVRRWAAGQAAGQHRERRETCMRLQTLLSVLCVLLNETVQSEHSQIVQSPSFFHIGCPN